MSQPNEWQAFIRTRTSVRRFMPEPIDPDTLARILETATCAPSAHNRQPWRFVVITRASEKSILAGAMAVEFARDLASDGIPAMEREAAVQRSSSRITAAPVAIVLCMDMTDMDQYPDEVRRLAERTMAIQSAANAGTTLLLAAHAEGLGGVWLCGPLFAPVAVKHALDLPSSWEPQALLLIGKPAKRPQGRPRRDLREVTVFK
jgi:coenzyme F420-0:L-glutamate ligase / coenzyme F420-1:gamma-L-glutamate ligase